jgi:hypothetical protein
MPSAVIEKVCKERPQDYLKVAVALLPKQMEIETNRTRPVRELSDAELLVLIEETDAELRQILMELRAVETQMESLQSFKRHMRSVGR